MLLPSTARPKASPRGTLIIALVFVGLGLVGCGFGAWGYLRERAFLDRAVHVEGSVFSQSRSTYKGNATYTPEFTFTDGAGNLWFVANREGASDPYEIGQKVPVVYNPDKPSEAHMVDFWSDWGMPVFCGGFGGFLLLTGAACIPGYLKARRDEAEAAGRLA